MKAILIDGETGEPLEIIELGGDPNSLRAVDIPVALAPVFYMPGQAPDPQRAPEPEYMHLRFCRLDHLTRAETPLWAVVAEGAGLPGLRKALSRQPDARESEEWRDWHAAWRFRNAILHVLGRPTAQNPA